MESVTIIAEASELLPTFKRGVIEILPGSCISDQPDFSGFVVQNQGSDRLYFDYEGSTLDTIIGWNEAEISLIHKYFPAGFHVYSIHYRSIETIKRVLGSIADSIQLLVDNDFGTLLPGSDFVRKILAEPKWNWRNDLNQT